MNSTVTTMSEQTHTYDIVYKDVGFANFTAQMFALENLIFHHELCTAYVINFRWHKSEVVFVSSFLFCLPLLSNVDLDKIEIFFLLAQLMLSQRKSGIILQEAWPNYNEAELSDLVIINTYAFAFFVSYKKSTIFMLILHIMHTYGQQYVTQKCLPNFLIYPQKVKISLTVFLFFRPNRKKALVFLQFYFSLNKQSKWHRKKRIY